MKVIKWRTVLGNDADRSVRDDRVLPITRRIAVGIIPFLAAAFLVLYGLPDQTTALFAWTIQPEMTPIIMGAGYGAGVYFFYRVATVHAWHKVAPVFPGIAAFTSLMAIATVVHWKNFNHSHYTFYLWVILYALTPILIPAVWALNRQTASDPMTPSTTRLPRTLQIVGGCLGLLVTGSAVILFLVPEFMIGSWPWTVSPLTARILAGWFTLFGVVNTGVLFDPRWSALRILVHSQLIGFTLVLAGAVRVWSNFDPSNTLTWGVVSGMVLYVLALAVIYVMMESK